MKVLLLSKEFDLPPPGTTVYLCTSSGEPQPCTIRSVRKTGGYFIISCHDIKDRQSASSFRGAVIAVPASSLPPPQEGTFFHEEIIGLTAVTTTGEEIGRVIDILQTPAHDVYIVGRDEKEYLVPAVREFVVKILLDEKKIIVREMEGLFD